ncbi:Rgg/GadR/MutR family transcriptional regulator [Furfurilactobacillus cerevisiae]|uniref:Rgg/GadR/MutR family transcriptional regulator n=1 Tax=Furfurilactobacillus rossiae TaxID=231049 RepID=UPI003B97ED53
MELQSGLLFREIRIAKRIPAIEVYQNIISKNMLYKFEHGQSDITMTRFLSLLKRINMSIQEFEFLSTEKAYESLNKNFIDLQKHSLNAFNRGNILILKECREITFSAWKSNRDERYQRLLAQMNVELNILNGHHGNNKDIKIITNYLFSCDTWYAYEWNLFTNIATELNAETDFLLLTRIIRKFAAFCKSSNSSNDDYTLCICNVLFACIEQRNIILAEKTYHILKSEQIPQTEILPNILITFFDGIFDVLCKRHP